MPRLSTRSLRRAAQLAVSAGAVVYLLWRIDWHRAAAVVAHADVWTAALALLLFVATTWPLAWRWQLLLRARGIDEPHAWLVRQYFVGQAASQVLPTAIGGDAVRIVEHARRRPEARATVAGAVLAERATGAVATFLLAALGLTLAAAGRAPVGAFVPLEAALGLAALLGTWLVFADGARPAVARLAPAARALRVAPAARALYLALREYRHLPGTLTAVVALSLAIQLVRVLGVWLCGNAVGIDLSPAPYLILAPLLFLVMLVPVTVNGLGVREAFFVAFLGRYGVASSDAFAAGFLFFAATVLSTLPGAVLFGLRRVPHTTSATEGN